MIDVKCISKIRNEQGIITGYQLQDNNGNIKVVQANELKEAIKRGEVNCTNLQLTSDNRLIDKKDGIEKLVVKTRVIGGTRDIEYGNATYRVKAGKVLLLKVHIRKGEFEIPNFVDGTIFDDEDEETGKSPFSDCEAIKLKNNSKLNNFNSLFTNCQNLRYIDLSRCNMHKITSTIRMFYNCNSLETVVLNGADMSNIQETSFMFSECTSLKRIDFSKTKFKHVQNMSFMFYGSTELETVCLEGINIPELKSMSSMFRYCKKLNYVNMKKVNMHNLERMDHMFRDCGSLREIKFPGIDVSSVKTFDFMFYNCEHLYNVDLSNFRTSPDATMHSMFDGCKGIAKLDISNFSEPISMNDRSRKNIFDRVLPDKMRIPDWLKKYIWRYNNDSSNMHK